MSSRFDWERALRQANLPPTRKLVLQTLSSYANKAGEARPSQERIAEASGLTRRTVGTHIRAAIDEGWVVRLVKGRSKGRGGKALASVYVLTIPTVDASNGKEVPTGSQASNGKQVPTGSPNEWEPDDASNGKEVPTFITGNTLSSRPPVENEHEQHADPSERLRQIQRMLRDRERGPFDDETDFDTPALSAVLGKLGKRSA